MEVQPVFILGSDGKTIVLPASEAAVEALPRAGTKVTVQTIDLSAPLTDFPVPFGSLSKVFAYKVTDLAGATVEIKWNSDTEDAVPHLLDDSYEPIYVSSLLVTTPGGMGGTMTLVMTGA